MYIYQNIGIAMLNSIKILPRIFPIFRDFAASSGLKLNVLKTNIVSLHPSLTSELITRSLTHIVPQWATIPILVNAKYLGFYLGPGGQAATWNKILKSMTKVADKWAKVHPGALYSVLACNTYITSKISFVAQCFDLPCDIGWFMRKLVAKLFVGPGNWITPEVLYSLKSIGFLTEVVDPRVLAKCIMRRHIFNDVTDFDDLVTEAFLVRQAFGTLSWRHDHLFSDWISFPIPLQFYECVAYFNRYGYSPTVQSHIYSKQDTGCQGRSEFETCAEGFAQRLGSQGTWPPIHSHATSAEALQMECPATRETLCGQLCPQFQETGC